MIPTKLILRNFLPYKGEVTLDLHTVRIACIAGDNGAGKSSLLDAITWSLWGKARGGSERDLMSLGTTEMGVDFQFLLGEQEYRVLRRRRRRGNSPDVPQLEVQVRAQSPDGAGTWRAITGDTVSQTQKILTATLGMEYDTFINSAFILQGRADEFTTKGATERKQVLADILGLGRYDALEERARVARREAEQGRKEIDATLVRIDAELLGRPAAEAELIAVATAVSATQLAIGEVDDALQAVRAQREEASRREEAAREAQRRRDEHAREAERLGGRIALAERRIAELEATIARAATIRAGYDALQRTIAEERVAGQALAQLNGLQGRHREAERQVERAQNLLLQEQHALDHQLAELRKQRERLPAIEPRFLQIEAKLKEVSAADELRPVLSESISSAKEEMGGRKAENERLKNEMLRLKDLQTQMTEQGAICTICRRPVSDHDRQQIHDEYQAEGLQRKAEYTANRQRIAALEGEIAQYTAQLTDLDARTRQGRSLAREEGDLRRQVTTAREAGVRLLDVTRDRDAIAAQLAGAAFAPEARAQVAELAAAIAALAYDGEAHRRLQARVAELTPYDEQARALERAEQALGPERERLVEDRGTLRLREGARDEEAARIAELLAERADLPALIRRTEDLSVQLDQARRRYEELARRQGSLEATLGRLAYLEEEAERSRESRSALAEAEGIYRELARAFGKGGIQAMIIEGAVPELQDEANAILANMPGNSMRVEFRTQRETRKGDTVEALEIVIGDEAGQRDYAMYSGGEAFRINFAIRVALAKLLARRAGAKLQMLVIDEGFGTQDARGRDSLVEAIHAIEDDFQMVLVITHVNELKDLFPTQILVEKGPTGSQVTIS